MKGIIIGMGLAAATIVGASGATLDTVKQRGTLVCGVSTGFAGFSAPDSQGNFKGLDVDYCRALAAGVLGDASKVRYVALTAQNRFTALQSGEIDVLYRNSTQTYLRGTTLGLRQDPINFYDGQGFVVKKDAGVKDLKVSVIRRTGAGRRSVMSGLHPHDLLEGFDGLVPDGESHLEPEGRLVRGHRVLGRVLQRPVGDLNGEIALLGRKYDVPAPANATLQMLANRAARQGAPPGGLRPQDIVRAIADEEGSTDD